MNESVIKQVATHFGLLDVVTLESFSEGLIHHTYKVLSTDNRALIIQAINTHVFQQPEVIISNYRSLYTHLHKQAFIIPAPVVCANGDWLWRDDTGVVWRAQEFIENSYSEKSVTPEKAFQTSLCFAQFAHALADLNPDSIQETIIHFHDLRFRYQQVQKAIQYASEERLTQAKNVINEILSRKSLIQFYDSILMDDQFRRRIMHHDSKLTNIVFNRETHQAICPVDLDTTMPGYYFSDLGDLVRSMVASVDENSTAWDALTVNKQIYEAIVNGYRSGIGNAFTEKENEHLHHAGLLLIFMQAIRFLTDFLSNDRYYKISYPEQNLNRAKNQLILLEKLEYLLKEEYRYSF